MNSKFNYFGGESGGKRTAGFLNLKEKGSDLSQSARGRELGSVSPLRRPPPWGTPPTPSAGTTPPRPPPLAPPPPRGTPPSPPPPPCPRASHTCARCVILGPQSHGLSLGRGCLDFEDDDETESELQGEPVRYSDTCKAVRGIQTFRTTLGLRKTRRSFFIRHKIDR